MNVVDHVVVSRLVLHRPGRALHVHDHHPGRRFDAHLGHSRFPQPADVVDDLRPGADGRSRHPRLRRIDRDDGPFGDEGRDDGHDAPALFGFVHRVGSRAGGLTTDVHDVGAGIDKLHAVGNGCFGRREGATIRKRVRSHVDDPHEERVVFVGEAARAKPPYPGLKPGVGDQEDAAGPSVCAAAKPLSRIPTRSGALILMAPVSVCSHFGTSWRISTTSLASMVSFSTRTAAMRSRASLWVVRI